MLLILFVSPLSAQMNRPERGGRIIGMGGAFTGLSNSSYAIFYNPAGLASMPFREASVFYTQPYSLSELATFSFSYADPLLLDDIGAFGVSATRFGFELYNETSFSLSYAGSYAKKFFYGVSLSYHGVAISGYGSDAAFGVDLGILAFVTPDLTLGFSAMNLNGPRIGVEREAMAQTYTFGVSYRLTEALLVLSDLEKDVRFPLLLKSGVEFFPIPEIALRTGFNVGLSGATPAQLTGGFGLRYTLMDLDYAILNHPDLGMSHQLSISFRFGKGDTPENADLEYRELIETAFTTAKQELADGKKIALNSASLEDLMLLPGMTTALAKRILDYRRDYRRFNSISELRVIRGLNRDRFNAIERYVILDEE